MASCCSSARQVDHWARIWDMGEASRNGPLAKDGASACDIEQEWEGAMPVLFSIQACTFWVGKVLNDCFEFLSSFRRLHAGNFRRIFLQSFC